MSVTAMSVEAREQRVNVAGPGAELQAVPLHLEMREKKEIQYSIVHTDGPIFGGGESVIAEIVGAREVILVVDDKVQEIYGKALMAHARTHLNVLDTLVIPGDEAHKTWTQAESICHSAMQCALGRCGVIVAVGGGVVLDVGGFAASIYRRGVGYLRIPTTLIGQVDVSVGVKQGINVGRRKNVLGSFYAPLASINDTTFLGTLSTSHLASGMAEIIKMAMIADPVLFTLIELHGAELVACCFQEPAAAARAIMMRAEAAMLRELKGNLFETTLQRSVDYGHTFSVVLETDSDYALPHGHAVGLDMLISTCVAVGRGLCPENVLERMLSVYEQVGLPVSQNICSAERLLESLNSVRRHRDGALNLVVPQAIGRPMYLQEIAQEELRDALHALADAQMTHDRSGL
jgi:3-dehydroquinate synthetase